MRRPMTPRKLIAALSALPEEAQDMPVVFMTRVFIPAGGKQCEMRGYGTTEQFCTEVAEVELLDRSEYHPDGGEEGAIVRGPVVRLWECS